MSALATTKASATRARRTLGWLLLAPAVVLLGAVVAYPVGRLLYASLHQLNLVDPAATRFVGLANYAELFADPNFWHATGVTLRLALVTIPGAMLLGLVLALAADSDSRWRWAVRLALLLPWALPPGFCGMMFAWFFNSDYGVVNDLLVRLGQTPRPFLVAPGPAFFAVSLASIWKASSFVALILLAGLQTIPAELVEVARLEGATRWQRFRHVTLPLLWPSILVALIFRSIAALQAFDIPYSMTQGGPGRSNETLAILTNTLVTEFLDIGYGSALATLLLGLSLVLSVPYLRGLYRSHD